MKISLAILRTPIFSVTWDCHYHLLTLMGSQLYYVILNCTNSSNRQMPPLLNYQEYFIPCTNVKLINKDERWGGGGGSLWPRAMCNDNNPMSDNHPGTVTLLTSET